MEMLFVPGQLGPEPRRLPNTFYQLINIEPFPPPNSASSHVTSS